MKDLFQERKLYLYSSILGGIFLILTLIIYLSLPQIPSRSFHPNLNSLILNLELAENTEQIYNILGGPEEEGYYKKINDLKSTLNYIYMYIFVFFLYILILFEIGYQKSHIQPVWKLLFYILLSITIFFNLIENYKLGEILDSKSRILMENNFQYLRELSLLGYICFFLTCGIIGMFFWLSGKGYWIKNAGVLLFTSFTLSIVGLKKFYMLEVAFYFFNVGIIFTFLYTLYYAYSNFRKLI